MPRPRISWGKIAYRIGAVSRADLDSAREERDREGGTLEEILIRRGRLDPELAEFVRDAFVRACAVCERCGRRTDVQERDPEDFACRCGGQFVPIDEDTEIDPALMQSEMDDESSGEMDALPAS